MDKNPFKLIEFGVVASVGALALIGTSTLIGHAKRAKQARIQHENLEYPDEKIQDLIKEGYIPIATAEELNSIRNTSPRFYGVGTEWKAPYAGGLSERYVQVKDIDLSEYGDWTPIGTLHANFRGTYDGGNYVITGLKIKSEDKDYQGLFGRTEGATIRNVPLEDVNVTGANNVGGLVGYASNTNISNSCTTGEVTGRGQVGGLIGGTNNSMISKSYTEGIIMGSNQVGGLVGLAYNNAEISNSYSTCSSIGLDIGVYIGGLVGRANSGTMISNSYATGTVTGSSALGGLVGVTVESTIKNSYAKGTIKGGDSKYIGGLVGWAWDDSAIENSYATGLVKGNNNSGGLVGRIESSTVTSSYWDTETTGRSWSAEVGTGKSTNEMKDKETYLDWDFVDVWKIDNGDYPTLR